MDESSDPQAALAQDELTKVDRAPLGMKPGRKVVVVSESALYRLIVRADGAASKPFRDCVVKEPGNTCFTVL